MKLKHPFITPTALVSGVVGLIALHTHGRTTNALLYVGVIGLGIAFICVCSYFFIPINRAINDAGRVVKRGVPSPELIRLQFIQSMGREPTIEEVAALHQMAKSEYNQALLTLGALGLGAYATYRTFRGESLL
jgi:hypothetical protein